eukprot:TRINITY_DN11797_c0_g1_i1.p2 TRINITY_DN11797_c0_g1~~TRINITY_DN11797_c0_g1_i1.p2  ORF type:complete len:289 (-),score=69.30 TRINITY_DN11797_c0_g1_i1:897-1763(-)
MEGQPNTNLRMKHSVIPGGVALGGWECTSHKTHISPSNEIDDLSRELNFVAPEQLYLSNSLRFKYSSGQADSPYSLDITFSAADALRRCAVDDWTFKPVDYFGRVTLTTLCNNAASSNSVSSGSAEQKDSVTSTGQVIDVNFSAGDLVDLPIKVTNPVTDGNVQIDMDMLKRRDPILFYDSVVLYEDELHDHGHCTVSVKTRVMESCFLILLRYWLRVDKERMHINDVRIFHKFGSQSIVYDVTEHGETFENLRRRGLPHSPADYPTSDSASQVLELKDKKIMQLQLT